MKNLLIKIIEIYQKTPLHTHKMCKYYPTCSNYAKEALNKYGFIKGLWLAIKRIIRCNPFSKGGVDLVP